MMDDYQYKTLNLPSKNEGLFGLGGFPSSEGIGFAGKTIDSSTSGINAGGAGITGPQGLTGATGATGMSGGFPPNPQFGDILYYDGNLWKKLNAPAGNGILAMKDKVPRWIVGTTNSVLIYNGFNNLFETMPVMSNSGRYLLYNNSNLSNYLTWIQVQPPP